MAHHADVTSADPYKLQRFIDAQEGLFEAALQELRAGQKRSHWMWFIFPQLAELGRSPAARFYGIGSLDELLAYLAQPLLGPRLVESVEALLPWVGRRNAEQILGAVDSHEAPVQPHALRLRLASLHFR